MSTEIWLYKNLPAKFQPKRLKSLVIGSVQSHSKLAAVFEKLVSSKIVEIHRSSTILKFKYF